MTFALPWVFAASVAASIMVGVLHLLSTRQPSILLLPTARFVTGGDARAVARRPWPNDLLLLALRVLVLLLAGAALAGVQLETGRARTVQLVMVDSAMYPDSALWQAAIADDSVPDHVERQVHAVAQLQQDPARALVRATEVAAALANARTTLEQVELIVVLPETVATLEGWHAWREQWPGAVRVRLAGQGEQRSRRATAADTVLPPSDWRGEVNDAAAIALRAAFGRRAVPDEVTLIWPGNGVPDGWVRQTVPDTASAVAAMGQALVGPFVRVSKPSAGEGRALAWWSDGTVAATEQRVGPRCIRRVGVQVPQGSDLLLSAPAHGLLQVLRSACGSEGLRSALLLSDSALASASGAATASTFRLTARSPRGTHPDWLGPALLIAALLLLGGEWLVRRREVAT